MGQDLGTYHVRVTCKDDSEFIFKLNTGARYISGSDETAPKDAKRIGPIHDSEENLFDNTVYMFTEGNFSCDCNLSLFLAWAYQQDEEEVAKDCGSDLAVQRLVAIRPNGEEVEIYKT